MGFFASLGRLLLGGTYAADLARLHREAAVLLLRQPGLTFRMQVTHTC